ncbi:MAG: Zn-dependent alcohol dehydrogenase [Chloroflexi bacterium]|nr:Zn-dependent alcohol dehydrogenase [Chloroflexota bacterium]
MKIKAAVLYEINTPLVVETLDLDDPKEGEVLVHLVSAGVCHSDYHVMKGEWQAPLPMVLGHEAAGIVEKVGPGVTLSKPGDHVILNFRPNCGWCKYCTVGRPVLCNGADTARWMMFDGTSRLHKGSQEIYHFARTASFGEYVVVPQSGAVPVRDDMPLDKACLIGCSVMTGVGAVINAAKLEAGSSVLVIGCGGVGLNIIQGAVLAGAGRIIAVDLLENKLAYARDFGATDIMDAGSGDVAARVRDLTDGGVDYAFEAIGNSKTIVQAYESTCPGGVTVVVGMAPDGDQLTIASSSLPRMEKTIMGTWYGSARPWVDLPKMVDLYLGGKLQVDSLISRTYPLDDINIAYEALSKGEVARSILLYD